MGDNNCYGRLMFTTCLVAVSCVSLYIAGLLGDRWVTTDTNHWGLWRWCFNKNYHGSGGECYGTMRGDNPGYYDGVRALAIMTLVIVIVQLSTCCFKFKLSLALILLGAVSAASMFGLFFNNYSQDVRWKDLNPSPGRDFWFVFSSYLVSLCISGASSLYLHCMSDQKKAEDSNNEGGPHGETNAAFATSSGEGTNYNSMDNAMERSREVYPPRRIFSFVNHFDSGPVSSVALDLFRRQRDRCSVSSLDSRRTLEDNSHVNDLDRQGEYRPPTGGDRASGEVSVELSVVTAAGNDYNRDLHKTRGLSRLEDPPPSYEEVMRGIEGL